MELALIANYIPHRRSIQQKHDLLWGEEGKSALLDIPLKIHSAAMRATRDKNEFKKSILSCKYLVDLNSNAFLNERPGSCSL